MDDTLIIVLLAIGISIFSILVIIGFFSAIHRLVKPSKTKKDILEANRFGQEGEEYVSYSLKDIIDKYGGYLYDGFCFEYKKGYSTEIDHLLITSCGVFVIETKTYKGDIKGSADDGEWICIKKDYQEDKVFRNPIIQNQRHINHLRRLFTNHPPKMISIVIFPIANISSVNSEVVLTLGQAEYQIIEAIRNGKYSKEYMNRINNQIIDIQNKYGISKEQHIKNINRIYH